MKKKSRWVKITAFSLLIGVALGGAIMLGRAIFAVGAERLLKSGEEAHAKGVEALQAGDAGNALTRFDEANLQANKVLDDLVRQRQDPKNHAGEAAARLTRIEGRALWLKARALRDRAYVKGILDGHVLSEKTDSISGEKFRTLLAIPDAKVREEALNCIREAGRRLTEADDAEVQKEALRTEMMLEPTAWELVERLARQAVRIDAKDIRGLYLLARFEYEQPPADGRPGASTPTPESKRERSRVLKARDYVTQLKKTDNYPLWRTLFLEAQIARWLRRDAAERGRAAEQESEDQTLRALLLHPENGALARARRVERQEHLSLWDVQGLLGLHLMALEWAAKDSRESDEAARQTVELLGRTLEQCRKLIDQDAIFLGECVLSAITAMNAAQPYLAVDPPADRKGNFDPAKMNKASLYPEMRDLFELARRRYPRDPRMCLYLGHAHAGLLEPAKADKLYGTALELANGAGHKVLTPQQCKEVVEEVQAARKKLKQTAQR